MLRSLKLTIENKDKILVKICWILYIAMIDRVEKVVEKLQQSPLANDNKIKGILEFHLLFCK